MTIRGVAALHRVRATVAAAALLALVGAARADDEALVRVLAEQAQVHTGPGFAFRVVYLAARGEVFPVVERATRAHWFRVRLPDGTNGWIWGTRCSPWISRSPTYTAAPRSGIG